MKERALLVAFPPKKLSPFASPSRTFCVTVNVLPVSRGTVQFTGSGERMIICSGDFTLVGSGGLFTTGSLSSQGLACVSRPADAGAWVVCDGGVEATLESPAPVTSPFTWGSAVTGTLRVNRFIIDVDARPILLDPLPPPVAPQACTRSRIRRYFSPAFSPPSRFSLSFGNRVPTLLEKSRVNLSRRRSQAITRDFRVFRVRRLRVARSYRSYAVVVSRLATRYRKLLGSCFSSSNESLRLDSRLRRGSVASNYSSSISLPLSLSLSPSFSLSLSLSLSLSKTNATQESRVTRWDPLFAGDQEDDTDVPDRTR